jgi:DNA polymerase-3 subunit delta'
VSLTPADGAHRVYIIDQAELLGAGAANAANAFLKTLEEPPPHAVIVLLAASYDSVLPTIASRCHVVRFRQIAPSQAERLVAERTGASVEDARAALAATGGVLARAVELLGSAARLNARGRMLGALKDLAVMDGHDVLATARELLASVRAPLDDLKTEQAEEAEAAAQFLKGSSGTALQQRHKREVTAREREAVLEVLNIAESWLRDCFAVSQGVRETVANEDTRDAMDEVAAVMTPKGALRALDAVRQTRRRISYNVSPQLAVEAMLFDIREVLTCPR